MKLGVLAAAGLCAGLLVVGCGGDDDLGASAGATTTAGGGDDVTTTAEGGSDSGDFVFDAGECANIGAALAAGSAGIAAAFTGSAADLPDFDESLDELKRFKDAAPAEIQEDVQTVIATYAQFAEIIDDSGIDLSDPSSIDAAAAAQLAQELSTIDNDAAQVASANISAYMQENCT
jgi:hypothetical protein